MLCPVGSPQHAPGITARKALQLPLGSSYLNYSNIFMKDFY